MNKFMQLFHKVGGKEMLRQYRRAHVLAFAILQTLSQGFSKKSLEIVRLAVNNRVLRKLRKKYQGFINQQMVEEAKKSSLPRVRSNKVWVCWLQGMEHAPQLVQTCYRSLEEHMTDREIILLTEDNYRAYVQFPEHIQSKIDRGVITRTHMSDLLRLELLLNHGGTWIDATVLCTGSNIPAYMLDSDLFMFQNLKPGLDGDSTRISSWFMTACTNHPILRLTRSLLYEYWKDHEDMVDYFLIHDFCELAIETYPEEWAKVVPFSNATPHILLLRLFEKYEEEMWTAVRTMTPFHKLTYKFEAGLAEKEDTYYSVLLKNC